MRKFYFYSLLMVLLLGVRAGWAQNYTANFTTSPAGCGDGTTGCESFQITLGGVAYVFAFTPDNGGGSFKHYPFGGVDNGPAMDLRSKVFDRLTTEQVTITRLDGQAFSFSSIHLNNYGFDPVTLQGFLGATPVTEEKTLAAKSIQAYYFQGVSVTSVRLISVDFYDLGLDDFTVCVAPSVSFNAAGLCLGAATSFTNTSTSVLPGATYEWDFNSDNVIDATIANPSYTYPAAGDYTAKLTIRQGGCVSSATKSIKINTPPTATLSGGGTFCTGGKATLSIALTGTAPWSVTYTDGTTPVTRTNILTSPLSVDVTPVTSKTYTLTAVSSATCTGTFSGSAPVTVNTLPAIANQPAGATTCIGGSVTFNVGATGTSLSYQWKKNGVNIPQATGSTYSINNLAVADAGEYTVEVSGICSPAVISEKAVLVVNQAPAITSQPVSEEVCAGGSASFSATTTNVTGYQWQVNTGSGFVNVTNNAIYSGATTATLDIAGAPAGMNGYQYRLVVTGACTPVVTSNVATLTVNAPPAITESPVGATKCAGEAVAFSVTATGTDLTYQWKKNGTNIPDATNSMFSIGSASVGDAGSYTVQVSGVCSAPLTSAPAVLVVNQAPAITSQPVSEEVCVGSNVSLTVGTSNATGHQWQVNTGSGFVNVTNNAIYSGATTATLDIAGAPANLDGYQYRLVVTGACPPVVTSNVATLNVNAPPVITESPVGATKCAGEAVAFSVTATGTDLTYQWKKNGTNIPDATSSTFSIPSTAVGDAGSYTVQVSGVCSAPLTSAPAVLVVNQAPALTSQPVSEEVCAGGSASFSATTTNATGHQWQVNTGSGFVNVSNNAIYSGATTGTLDIAGATAGMNGYQYRLVVTGACPPVVTSNVAALAVSTSASITSVTVSGTQCAGSSVTFSVAATGTDLTYQWKKNGTNIPGATSSTYNLASMVVGDAGTYTVVVGAACGLPVVSSPSELVVSVPPAITSQPAAVGICTGSNASFSIGASNATAYQWQVNTGSGFTNLANGGVYSGTNTATLLITGATTALNGHQYRAIASGTCPPVATSTAATLNVGNPTALGSFTPLAGPVLIGTSVKMTIAFSGSAPGTAVWHWKDGTTSNATVVGSTLTGTHLYALPGVYTPTLTVNSCGGSTSGNYEYVVVYDPNGGYITGSGWFNSPAGAYRPQPSLEGRVNFGFVSKYKKGTTVPDGRTEFLYRMGNLSFHSTAYEWLVISGSKGQYRGSGTINGTGNYGFILTAIDGGKRPDRLRMKIWNKANNAVVYDNQFGAGDTADPTTVINGGSIMIKAPSKSAREGVEDAEMVSPSGSSLRAYPNPFTGEVVVDLSGFAPGRVQLDITDQQGRSVHRQEVQVGEQEQSVRLDLVRVQSGLYLLQAKGQDGQKWTKLIKR